MSVRGRMEKWRDRRIDCGRMQEWSAEKICGWEHTMDGWKDGKENRRGDRWIDEELHGYMDSWIK